jgi:putative transposase
MKTVADVLGVARSHLHERVHRPAPPRGHFCKADEELLPLIRRVVDQRPTYGYRRVTALVNRVLTAEGKPATNHKRSSGSLSGKVSYSNVTPAAARPPA